MTHICCTADMCVGDISRSVSLVTSDEPCKPSRQGLIPDTTHCTGPVSIRSPIVSEHSLSGNHSDIDWCVRASELLRAAVLDR